MGIRRIKDQKQTAQLRVSQTLYSYHAPAISSATTSQLNGGGRAAAAGSSAAKSNSAVNSAQGNGRQLFAYDVRLIFQDLTKTVIITTAILLLLGASVWYLKR